MKCEKCGNEFGDLEAEKIREFFDSLEPTTLVRVFICPKCGAEVEDVWENYEGERKP